MPEYVFAYAYDVPHYADFSVTAPTQAAAQQTAQAALNQRRFKHVVGDPYEATTEHHRVFFLRKKDQYDKCTPTMEALVAEADAAVT